MCRRKAGCAQSCERARAWPDRMRRGFRASRSAVAGPDSGHDADRPGWPDASAIIGLASRAAILHTIDLHCHSDCSDGALAPQALIARAATRGLRAIALTDHDTVAGVPGAGRAAGQDGIALIPGLEISVSWGAKTLHVLGLRIDPAAPQLLQGLASVRETRMQRAEQIALRLRREGVGDTFDAILASAASGATVSRVHF